MRLPIDSPELRLVRGSSTSTRPPFLYSAAVHERQRDAVKKIIPGSVRCIDCQALDIGINPETDMWVHCSIKHAQALANKDFGPQPEITIDDATVERECEFFCDAEENKSGLFDLAEEMGIHKPKKYSAAIHPAQRKAVALDQLKRCFVCLGHISSSTAIHCTCGRLFHALCAARVGECPDCGQDLRRLSYSTAAGKNRYDAPGKRAVGYSAAVHSAQRDAAWPPLSPILEVARKAYGEPFPRSYKEAQDHTIGDGLADAIFIAIHKYGYGDVGVAYEVVWDMGDLLENVADSLRALSPRGRLHAGPLYVASMAYSNKSTNLYKKSFKLPNYEGACRGTTDPLADFIVIEIEESETEDYIEAAKMMEYCFRQVQDVYGALDKYAVALKSGKKYSAAIHERQRAAARSTRCFDPKKVRGQFELYGRNDYEKGFFRRLFAEGSYAKVIDAYDGSVDPSELVVVQYEWDVTNIKPLRSEVMHCEDCGAPTVVEQHTMDFLPVVELCSECGGAVCPECIDYPKCRLGFPNLDDYYICKRCSAAGGQKKYDAPGKRAAYSAAVHKRQKGAAYFYDWNYDMNDWRAAPKRLKDLASGKSCTEGCRDPAVIVCTYCAKPFCEVCSANLFYCDHCREAICDDCWYGDAAGVFCECSNCLITKPRGAKTLCSECYNELHGIAAYSAAIHERQKAAVGMSGDFMRQLGDKLDALVDVTQKLPYHTYNEYILGVGRVCSMSAMVAKKVFNIAGDAWWDGYITEKVGLIVEDVKEYGRSIGQYDPGIHASTTEISEALIVIGEVSDVADDLMVFLSEGSRSRSDIGPDEFMAIYYAVELVRYVTEKILLDYNKNVFRNFAYNISTTAMAMQRRTVIIANRRSLAQGVP